MMKLSRKILGDLLVGGVLSSLFCALLVVQIIDSGVGKSTTFLEFLSIPDNILFSLLMSMFIFASFLFRGINNRVVLFCWAIMIAIYFAIYSAIYDYFYHVQLNIYILIMAGLAGSLSTVIVLRYRVFVTTILLAPIGKAGLFSKQIRHYLGKAKATDFEVNMEVAMYVAFTVEFLNSLYLLACCFLNQIPYDGSITQYLKQNNIWDPYFLYYWLLRLVTLSYILIIAFYIYRDNTDPDAYMHGYTKAERRQASLRVLEKYRKQAKEKQSKKRD